MFIQECLFSYWDIIWIILTLFLLIPFVYIGYLKRLKLPEKKELYHFSGVYNGNKSIEIITYVEKLENLFGKKFYKFKNLLSQIEKDPTTDKRMYIEAVESILFCIKLNGQKRWNVFWKLSDSFLKILIGMLPIVAVFIVIISKIYFDFTGLVFSIILTVFCVPFILIFFTSFLKIWQYIFQKKGISLPALSIAYIALDALINSQVSRDYDKISESYYYYSTIHKYNNLVNKDFKFGNNHIATSSEILGDLKNIAIGDI